MKLSEAIRLGAMLHPQAFGHLAVTDERGHVLATCALGAAQEAGFHLTEEWKRGECPVCGLHVQCLTFPLVSHLNDSHEWTREQIADWVETVEPAEHPAAVEEAVIAEVRP